MTNEELWQRQQQHRAHMAAVPIALDCAKSILSHPSCPGPELPVEVPAHVLETLVAEVERLQVALKRAHQDLRDEQREAQHAAGAAYSEGRHDGMSESRGY